jgi:hypothetical protein
MNDDELKKLWQDQPLRTLPAPSASQLISAMQNKTTQLRRTLFARDVRELLACVVVGVIFGIYYFTERAPVTRLGALITVAGAIFIAARILFARRMTPVAKLDATVIESLRAELHAVRIQSQMLRSVFWWYLLPLAVGTLVFVWGTPLNNIAFKIGFTLVTAALDIFIYRLNQRARAKQLLPLEAQLESQIRSAETGEPLDATHVANLRPIVLSMAAAESVKPTEFKVAFWQIALFGEIGFVGIWFFLMLSLAMSDKTNEPSPKSITPTVHVSETNRYFIVAKKVVDLFNAHDYAGVQNLYDADMAEVFPPKDTFIFYTNLAAGFGKIENVYGSIGKGYEGWPAFQLQCQSGELTMSLALDDEDKISGIYFKPANRLSPSLRSIVRGVFSWKRLIWIVPFFLAGLLYSRFLQKTTDRAVGISALGIHICKGQNLILWDEIKDVRPFRLLHVRSLWLIHESGEKKMIPWTSLERHTELKAAVESSAPENHLIRNYLLLL